VRLCWECLTKQAVRSSLKSGHDVRPSAYPQWASSRHTVDETRLSTAIRTSRCAHFARLNTSSSVTPAGVRGFVIFNSLSVIDVMIRR
jgi:hypothetical protein